MSEFAKAQLLKYGWTEGKGLGRNENGITTALKPALKFDTAGIGHKDHDGNQWWETAYNKAASSFTVDPNSSTISIRISETDNEKGFMDKKSRNHSAKSKVDYGNFMKTSTLSNGNMVREEGLANVEVEDLEKIVPVVQLTDEELFKACGGRTAHKGARHGCRLNGKLDRIAKQEQEMLANLTSNTKSQSALLERFKTEGTKLRKRVRHSEDEESETDSNGNTILPLHHTSPEENPKFSKASRKKTNRKINDLTHKLGMSCSMNNEEKTVDDQSTVENTKISKKNSKKKKRKVSEVCDEAISLTVERLKTKKNKNKNTDKIASKKERRKKQEDPLNTELISRKLNNKISKKKSAKLAKKLKEKLETFKQTFTALVTDSDVQMKLDDVVINLEGLDMSRDISQEIKKSVKGKSGSKRRKEKKD